MCGHGGRNGGQLGQGGGLPAWRGATGDLQSGLSWNDIERNVWNVGDTVYGWRLFLLWSYVRCGQGEQGQLTDGVPLMSTWPARS